MRRETALNAIAEAMKPGEKMEIRCTSYWRGINSVPNGYDVYEVRNGGYSYVRHEKHEAGMRPNLMEAYSKIVK